MARFAGWMGLKARTRKVMLLLAAGAVAWRVSGPLSETWATWQQVSLLGSGDPRVQARAASALRLRGSEANRLLIGQVRIGNVHARAWACRLLAEDTRRGTDVLEALVLGLADSDDTVARTAAYALVAPLAIETWAARRYVRDGQYVIIPDPPYELLEPAAPPWPSEPPRPEVGATLRQVARAGRSTTVRLAALQAINGWYRPSDTPDAWLREQLTDPDPAIAATAARGLLAWRRHEDEAVSRLRSMNGSENPEPVHAFIGRTLASIELQPRKLTADVRATK
jgi:hypothetical protein